MEELSAIEVIQLKVTQETKVYEKALRSNASQSELIQIKERIKQYKSALKYVLNIYKNG